MEYITISAGEIDRLLALNDGDAALVFLCGKRGIEPTIGGTQLYHARKKLSGAGILPSSFAPRPAYSQSEIARSLQSSPAFKTVADETERTLGKALSPSELQTLHSMHAWHGLPPGVLLLLLHHCASEQERLGKTLTVRQMENEAKVWASEGFFTEESAEMYIQNKESRRERTSLTFRSLGISGRAPSATEKKYVARWLEMGFPIESIALAYDKTVVNTGKLAWGYCDSILRRWHEKGLHTPEEIDGQDKKPPVANNNRAPQTGGYEKNKEALRRLKGVPKDGG
jgi:DnaD/phage-associated family protein